MEIMKMNKENSEKYIEIVKKGNMDDMFDFGKKNGAEELQKIVQGYFEDILNLPCPDFLFNLEKKS